MDKHSLDMSTRAFKIYINIKICINKINLLKNHEENVNVTPAKKMTN